MAFCDPTLCELTRDEPRCILDPAHVYGPDCPDATFRVLKERELREYGEYRTRRLVLEAWDRLGLEPRNRDGRYSPEPVSDLGATMGSIHGMHAIAASSPRRPGLESPMENGRLPGMTEAVQTSFDDLTRVE